MKMAAIVDEIDMTKLKSTYFLHQQSLRHLQTTSTAQITLNWLRQQNILFLIHDNITSEKGLLKKKKTFMSSNDSHPSQRCSETATHLINDLTVF